MECKAPESKAHQFFPEISAQWKKIIPGESHLKHEFILVRILCLSLFVDNYNESSLYTKGEN